MAAELRIRGHGVLVGRPDLLVHGRAARRERKKDSSLASLVSLCREGRGGEGRENADSQSNLLLHSRAPGEAEESSVCLFSGVLVRTPWKKILMFQHACRWCSTPPSHGHLALCWFHWWPRSMASCACGCQTCRLPGRLCCPPRQLALPGPLVHWGLRKGSMNRW